MNGAWEQNFFPIEINLLQNREENRAAGGSLAVAALVAVVAGAGAIGLLWANAYQQVQQTDKKIAAVTAQIAQLEAAAQQSPAASAGISDYIALPGGLESAMPKPTTVLNELKRMIPLEANIVTFNMQNGGSIQLTGIFASLENAITFMQSVKASAHFELVGMSGMSKQKTQANNTGGDDAAAAGSENGKITLSPLSVTFELRYHQQTGKQGGGS